MNLNECKATCLFVNCKCIFQTWHTSTFRAARVAIPSRVHYKPWGKKFVNLIKQPWKSLNVLTITCVSFNPQNSVSIYQYYLGGGSNVRYHYGILHIRKPRLHVRFILKQQNRWTIVHNLIVFLSWIWICKKESNSSYLKDIKTNPKHRIMFQMLHKGYFVNDRTPTTVYKDCFLQIEFAIFSSLSLPYQISIIDKKDIITFFIVASLSLLIKW